MTTRAQQLDGMIERRSLPIGEFEIREAGNNALTFTGYASLFDKPYEMYGGPDKGGWIETVDPGAFRRTLSAKPDVVLLINHEGMPLARTSSGTMKLSTDKVGLKVAADLDTRDPRVQSLQVIYERRDMNQMSFAFRTNRQEWSDDETQRRMLELNLDKGDASIVNNGAQPATSSSLRSIEEALDLLASAELAEVRSIGTEKLLVVHRALTAATGREIRSVDDNVGDVAAAIDASLDAALACLNGGDVPQCIALLGACELSVDALLAALGIADADEAGDPANMPMGGMPMGNMPQMNTTSSQHEHRAPLTLAHAKRLALLDA